MISKEDARTIAEKCIDGHQYVIDPDSYFESEHCYVFGWNSRLFVEKSREDQMFFGNAPIIISKHDGSLVESGTQAPAWVYVKQYERKFKKPWWRFWNVQQEL